MISVHSYPNMRHCCCVIVTLDTFPPCSIPVMAGMLYTVYIHTSCDDCLKIGELTDLPWAAKFRSVQFWPR